MHHFKPPWRWGITQVILGAFDTFFAEPQLKTTSRPFVRDATDLKRWMFIVIVALLPATLWGIWNTGVHSVVYTTGSAHQIQALRNVRSLGEYIHFFETYSLGWSPWIAGMRIVLPAIFVSYTVGGLIEAAFAAWRGHSLHEGILVTGLLFPLSLPSTLPLWMNGVGIALGILLAKEVFGGTGRNFINPALAARAFLVFGYPAFLAGSVWIGADSQATNHHLEQIHVTQATPLVALNQATWDMAVIHSNAWAAAKGLAKPSQELQERFAVWNQIHATNFTWETLPKVELRKFITAPFAQGGLALDPAHYQGMLRLSEFCYGLNGWSNFNLFVGNIAGSIGETSTLACLLGGILLIITGVGSWRTIGGALLGLWITSWGMTQLPLWVENGQWLSIRFIIPPTKHLISGSFAFGMLFMATDPVSSPSTSLGRWIYGLLIGGLTICIRVLNVAYPEGVMLAILMGNVWAPLIDRWAIFRRRRVF